MEKIQKPTENKPQRPDLFEMVCRRIVAVILILVGILCFMVGLTPDGGRDFFIVGVLAVMVGVFVWSGWTADKVKLTSCGDGDAAA